MVKWCFGIYNFCRVHFFKVLLVILILFLTTQYITDIVIRNSTLPKLISFNLSLVSATQHFISWVNGSNKTLEHPSADLILTTPFMNVLQTVTTPVSSSANNASLLNETMPLLDCPLVPPKLVGRLKVLTSAPSFSELEQVFPDLDPGGRFSPKECVSRHRVAIIVPYRDREEHLRIFLHNMHSVLSRQQLDYGIYIVEEYGKTKFNRALLMNIGFVESLKQHDYQCFIFHDVDLIPEDDRNIYSCPQQPRHMSVAIDVFGYRLPYADLFGGVSALSRKHMETINGFSNEYWGWGGEDDDMSNRLRYHGFHITRYPANVARYKMLKHNKDQPNPDRYNKLYKGKLRYKTDGLNSLKYKVHDLVLKKLYTWVLVEIQPK